MDASCSNVIRPQKEGGMEQIISKYKPALPVLITWEEGFSINK